MVQLPPRHKRCIFLHVASLDSREDKSLGEASSNAVYSKGHLLFLRQDTLMAQTFDLNRLMVTGEAVPVAERIQRIVQPGTIGCFSVSATGLLAYRVGEAGGGLTLTWFDRGGKRVGTLGAAANFGGIEFSPDRRSLAARVVDQTGNADIWIYDVARGLPTRFTFDPAAEQEAIWSPDGKFVLYHSANPQTGDDLWILPVTGDRKPVPFVRTAFNEQNGQFSPDGRWVAYHSNESGNNEVYVVPFPGPGGKRQISAGGGSFPRWRQDGKEIFYIGADQRLTAAEVAVKSNLLEAGAVRPLFGPVDAAGGATFTTFLPTGSASWPLSRRRKQPTSL
ncbi:MAG: hypothetical protein ABSB35_27610 [Bryobacteraceae bacterium]|jgi:dipeptidyl aminopeptidase/acylaminoacyl peptidase